MTEALRAHVFAAMHFVLGPSNFLILRLPERWQVRIGRNPSEVDYSTRLGDVRWAAEGHATGFLLDPVSQRAIELDIRTARGSVRPAGMTVAQEGMCRVGSHGAAFALGQVPVGLRRRPEWTLRVAFRCEATSRHVELRFASRRGAEDLMALVPFLESAECH